MPGRTSNSLVFRSQKGQNIKVGLKNFQGVKIQIYTVQLYWKNSPDRKTIIPTRSFRISREVLESKKRSVGNEN